MTPELYQRATTIFSAATHLLAAERQTYLTTACEGDKELLRVVTEMLAADAAPLVLTGGASLRLGLQQLLGEESDRSDTTQAGAARPDSSPRFRMPERIGPYTITGFIGRGGMGEVFEARQENPSRAVAVKISPLAAASPAALRRFEREVEFLARLTHPGIAQIYDAGIADMGGVSVPYFAMELVRGTPLTEYVLRHDLNLRQRIELVASLCDSVQYAHQQGVIHRDLKPDNILIPSESGPVVAGRVPLARILDFGIARLAHGQLGDDGGAMVTEAGQPIGTPGFMAPEQIRGENAAIDTRCDVFALGVIAYLLFGGRPPHGDPGSSVYALTSATLEQEPARLGALNRACRGDLETVVAMAMHKDRDRRYGSAAEFGADLRRVLTSEPVTARPATVGYILRRFAVRHKPLVAAVVSVVVLALAAGILVFAAYRGEQRQRLAAEVARAEARREAQAQQDITSFLVYDTFGAASPSRRGTSVRATELIDEAAAAVDVRFPNDAVLRGRVRAVIANMLLGTGQSVRAEQTVRKAVDELGGGSGADDEWRCEALRLLGVTLSAQREKQQEARTVLQQAMQCGDATNPRVALNRSQAAQTLGEVLQRAGEHQEAQRILRRLIAETVPTDDASRVLAASSRVSLVAPLQAAGGSDAIETLLREAVEMSGQGTRAGAPAALAARNNYAAFLVGRGRFTEAEPIVLDLVERVKQTFPPDHPSVGYVLATAASVLVSNGRSVEGLAMVSRAVEIMQLAKDDGDFEVEKLTGLALRLHTSAGDRDGALRFLGLHLRARLLAAGSEEGAGVRTRMSEYRDLLASMNPAIESIDAGLLAYMNQCRNEIPLIVKAGGLQQSPKAARLMANLARASHSLRERHPGVAAEAPAMLTAARAVLAVSKQRQEDSVLIEAVSAELAGK